MLERFQRDTGKKITMVNTGQNWVSFDSTTMNAAIAAGEIPLVTMPLDVTLHEVNDGSQDSRIRAWAQAAKAFGYPFLFRPWWEPNGDWYTWGRNSTQTIQERSTEYIAAWHHFHDLVGRRRRDQCHLGLGRERDLGNPESEPGPWYPGDEYVDWVGMDAYNWGQNHDPAGPLADCRTIGPADDERS